MKQHKGLNSLNQLEFWVESRTCWDIWRDISTELVIEPNTFWDLDSMEGMNAKCHSQTWQYLCFSWPRPFFIMTSTLLESTFDSPVYHISPKFTKLTQGPTPWGCNFSWALDPLASLFAWQFPSFPFLFPRHFCAISGWVPQYYMFLILIIPAFFSSFYIKFTIIFTTIFMILAPTILQ